LLRKGIRAYVIGRLWRIGLPFLLAIIFLSPLSFYPAYLVRSPDPSITDFGQQWISLSSWPSGPQWFLWQLLVVNLLAAALYAVTPGYVQRLGHLAEWVGVRPARLFALLVVASVLAYFPLALRYSPWTWGSVGPFGLQLCRPAHYVVYFFTGVALGRYGLDRGLLACDGPLARNWLAVLAAAVVGFGAWAGLTSFTMPDWDKAGIAAQVAASLAFPFACAGGSLSLLAICLRFGRKRRWVLDSLSTNAYSIYLLHYVFILWLQYALLESELFALAKAMTVFGAALIMSWAVSIGFNRLLSGSALVTVKRATSPLPR